MDDEPETEKERHEKERQERREFLKRCGRFAAVTPPAMATLLVAASVPKEARASTIGRGHENDGPYTVGG